MKELFSNLTVHIHSNCSYIIAHSNFVFFLALSFAPGGGPGGAGAEPGVPGGRSVDPIPTRESRFYPNINIGPSGFSYLPTALNIDHPRGPRDFTRSS